MHIQIESDGEMIRAAFCEKFLMSWDAFSAKYQDAPFLHDYLKTTENYHIVYLWDKIDPEQQGFWQISFAEALDALRSLREKVFLMSENADKPDCHGICIAGVERKGCVASADPGELADLIEYEWYESWKAAAQDMYFDEAVLPEDLYVFDEAMGHVLIFTHENDHWELELTDPMTSAESRYCLMHGFPLSKHKK